MKGLIFREFLGMVEQTHGYETVDTIIEKAGVPGHGAYTSVGTYNPEELVALVVELGKETNVAVKDLLFLFGEYVFKVFAENYTVFFEGKKNAFEFLNEVENTIHVEVLKLYPEAELPTFEVEMIGQTEMVMVYKSKRKLYEFAKGLIKGCFDYFNEEASIEIEYVKDEGSEVLFRIKQ